MSYLWEGPLGVFVCQNRGLYYNLFPTQNSRVCGFVPPAYRSRSALATSCKLIFSKPYKKRSQIIPVLKAQNQDFSNTCSRKILTAEIWVNIRGAHTTLTVAML